MGKWDFNYDDYDNLSEKDRADYNKLIFSDILIGALISLQYGALGCLAMMTCFMAKLALGLGMFSGVLLSAGTLIYIWSVSSAHMKKRRAVLLQQIAALLEKVENRK
jgi:hypothetical protein